MGKAGMNKRLLLSVCCGIILSGLTAGCEQKLSAGFAVGERAPSLPTKTLADAGGNFSKVTTYRQPDPRMYQYSVDKALLTGKPIVLEFATPGHCTNCDEQLQMLKAILDKYQDQMIFIHIDQYENPQAYRAYQVMGDPWTFIIDKNGIVHFERAGRMLYSELDEAIKQIL
jgi:thiol-disulfide isomerase/thioredoxin